MNRRKIRQSRRKESPRVYRQKANRRLARFRQASTFAVALTALFIFFVDPTQGQNEINLEKDAAQSLDEAHGALSELFTSFLLLVPKISIAILILITVWLLTKLFKVIYSKFQKNHQKSGAIITLTKLFMYFVGIILAVTVLTGDIRALLGSVGLIGLALSWTLQQPIESFSGYLLNAFRSYYRVGDRISVGDVFGDVYRIDLLTTTVWELGGPGKSVSGAQFTGAMTTFPNSEVVRASIINYSRDFPFMWDEVTIGVANESDLSYTIEVLRQVTEDLIGESMRQSTELYQNLLLRKGLGYVIEAKPQVYLSGADSWTNCTIRYLVELRKRRVWSSLIFEKVSNEIVKEKHGHRIIPAYPKSIIVREK